MNELKEQIKSFTDIQRCNQLLYSLQSEISDALTEHLVASEMQMKLIELMIKIKEIQKCYLFILHTSHAAYKAMVVKNRK